ncbi:ABC transporter substrate-binding protein [Zeimonas arvi]|uniref:ABC transporter substrate-binding protein n=1 Tax=Zeimonas arvi TaxID=2498847 RepID=A0A5C8NYR8_9BURK|nr:ABC transporter substrate-binding protein [Zeimonas arvi]TXL66419.1 ABC transporter substrate-binding protein [Zeimonas arvi]
MPKKQSMLRKSALAFAITMALAGAAGAKTFRIADQGDALSMDPHSLNESLQLSFTGNIYEPLVGRDKKLGLVPALATKWQQVNPTTWRFELRKGVQFHDGTPFTADDVVFTFARAAGEGSDMRSYTNTIAEVKKIDSHTIDIITKTPFPIIPDVISLVYIMSKKWAEENKAERPVDKRKGVENAASFKANGTGPFRLRSRDPGVRTVLVRNLNYWDKVETNVDEVVFTPIGSDATRVAALISGEIDMMQPVPVQDIARLTRDPNLNVMQGPELRTIFLGMDQKRDELLFSNVKGKNPFKDQRVRQAFYQAIDIEAIKTRIMRGAATPTALMVAPGIKGFDPALNKRLPYSVDAARKLMADAGYANGFEVKMNCPNDRYVNDSEICQAVAGMLARINVKVNLEAETKGTYFPKILSRNTSFYMLGWTPGTYDSHNALNALMATPGEGGQGQFNLGSYSNPKLDELTAKIASETDEAKRNAMIAEAFKIHSDDVGHLPLHQQALAWAARKNVSVVQLPDNFNMFKWVVIK